MQDQDGRTFWAGEIKDLNIIRNKLDPVLALIADARKKPHPWFSAFLAILTLRIFEPLYQERPASDLIIGIDNRIATQVRPSKIIR